MLKNWNDLPEELRNDCIYKYYRLLNEKKLQLVIKRVFDIILSLTSILVFLPVFLIIILLIKLDSSGPVIYKQTRITQYCREFTIYKFRTMVYNADKIGAQLTANNDERITRIGKLLRKVRLDEIPQLLNVLKGDMTFVGTRPEVAKYVKKYTPEMMATFLLPAGITSEASIYYKDEDLLLLNAEDVDEIYINKILPDKMNYNLKSLENFSFINDIKIIIKTIIAVIIK